MALEDVRFPKVPVVPVHDLHAAGLADGLRTRSIAATRVITIEPPRTGEPYRVLVPQVNADGNDVSGIRLPEVAVPLGTYTGWNITDSAVERARISERPRRRIRAVRQDEGAARRERRQPSLDRRALHRTAGLSRQGQACGGRSGPPAVPARRRRAGRAADSRADLERRRGERSTSDRYRDAADASRGCLASHR